MRRMSKAKDLTGQTFGRLTVIKRVESNKDGRAQFLCKCLCGVETIKLGKLILNGHCRSCGCGEYENRVNNVTSHRLSDTRLYRIWCAMKYRCSSPTFKDHALYYDRGITVCDEWLNDFKAFYDWSMSHGYRDDLSIDRIDNNKGYSPDNCRWATALEQRLNQRPRKRVV